MFTQFTTLESSSQIIKSGCQGLADFGVTLLCMATEVNRLQRVTGSLQIRYQLIRMLEAPYSGGVSKQMSSGVFRMWFRLQKISVMFAILGLLLLACPTLAGPEGVTGIPVFFVTDRVLNDIETSCLDYKNIQLPEEQVNYGIKQVVPQNCDLSQIDPAAMSGLGWVSAKDYKDLSQVPKTYRDITLRETDFFKKLHEVLDPLPESRPILVFAHGCCTDFRDSIGKAGTLARYYCCPVVMYAWCAIPPTIPKYRDNEDTEANSEARFDAFMRRMEQEFHPGRIVVVAHSMGNRLVFNYMKARYSRYGSNPHHEQFKSTIFACADVKVTEFIANEERVAYNSQLTWVTANDWDKALLGSYVQSALYDRLGAPKQHLSQLTHTREVMIADTHPCMGASHDLPFQLISQFSAANIWSKEPLAYKLQKRSDQNLYDGRQLKLRPALNHPNSCFRKAFASRKI